MPLCTASHLIDFFRPFLYRHSRRRLGRLPSVGLQHLRPLLRRRHWRKLRRVTTVAVAPSVRHFDQFRPGLLHVTALPGLVGEMGALQLKVAGADAVVGLAVDLDGAFVAFDRGPVEGIPKGNYTLHC